jgi:hypothetical protein
LGAFQTFFPNYFLTIFTLSSHCSVLKFEIILEFSVLGLYINKELSIY